MSESSSPAVQRDPKAGDEARRREKRPRSEVAEPSQPMIISIASDDEGEENAKRTLGFLASHSNSSNLPSFPVMVAKSKAYQSSLEEALQNTPWRGKNPVMPITVSDAEEDSQPLTALTKTPTVVPPVQRLTPALQETQEEEEE
eukprot:3373341-Amphidinium_carterae.6